MTLFIPNAFSDRPDIIDDTRQFTLGIENELTHNKKINTPGSSLVSATSFTDMGDRVDNIWANGITDKVLIQIAFQALWIVTSGTGTFSAAIFINGNQLKTVLPSNPAIVNEAGGTFTAGNGKQWVHSSPSGLFVPTAPAASVTSAITTGLVVSDIVNTRGGLCSVILPTAILTPFTVGIRFKVSAGSVTITERKLWVRACAMTN